MDNSQNQPPPPPGVGTWRQAPPSHPPQCHADPQSYHPQFAARPDNASANNSGSSANIESAVQEAVLHAQVFIYLPDYVLIVAVMFNWYLVVVYDNQDIETQQVIQIQRCVVSFYYVLIISSCLMALLHIFQSDMQTQQVNLQNMGKTYFRTAVTLMHWR
jgi:hypothetical protein